MNNEQQNNNLRQMQKKNQTKSFLFLLISVLLICTIFYFSFVNKKQEISLSDFETAVTNNQVASVEITSEYIVLEYREEAGGGFAYLGPDFKDDVIEIVRTYNSAPDLADVSKIKLTSEIPSDFSWFSLLYPLLFFGGAFLIISLFAKQINKSNKQSMDFTKNRAKLAISTVSFKNVAGADEEKEEVKELVDFLKNPQKFMDMGARIPKGVLLVGPPGTGKTLLAKAVAGEAHVPFFSISGSDFMELFVGVGASRVRDMFDQAKKASPCIIFIDEIDAIGRQRGTGLGGGNDEREQTLNQLLVQMDGFETNEGIIIIAATNRADILDPALMRPGRFDRQIYMHVPDVKGREEILNVHARGKKFDSSVDFKQIARVTSGFTGAELENLLNEAAILAARENKTQISMKDISEGIDKVTMGPQKKSRIVTDKDKNITAFHESGHAIVGRLVKNSDPIHEVSIVPRGHAAGYTVSRPENDDTHMSKTKLYDVITMMLAGRKAEELFIGDYTTGASNDIERATSIARKMVINFGMGEETGLMFLGSENSYFFGKDFVERTTYSDHYATMIDNDVKKILTACEQQAEKLLSSNKKKVKTMVEVLLDQNTIYSAEVDMIMEGKSAKEIIEKIKKDNEVVEEAKKVIPADAIVKNSTDLKSNIIKTSTKKRCDNNEKSETAEEKKKSEISDIEVISAEKISDSIEDSIKKTNKKDKK